MDDKSFSIVVPVYNSEKTIARCLAACLKQDGLREGAEVIAVDDGSTDNSSRIIKQFPVRYIFQENSGPAKARNTGWKAANGDIVCFTDSDCIPDSDWVKRLVDMLKADTGVVLGSHEIANKNSLLAGCIHQEMLQRYDRMPRYVRAFDSNNVAIKREIMEETGGFDENYRWSSGEDNDLSYKILKLGYKIYFAKDALVKHHYPESLIKYLKIQYRHGFWRTKLYREHPEMLGGDDYTYWKDIAEIPLSILIIVSFFLLLLKIPRLIFFISLAIYLIIQLPAVLKIIFHKKDLRYLYFVWISTLRGFARCLGFLSGLLSYFVRIF